MDHWSLTDIQVLIAAIVGLTLVLLVKLSYIKAGITRREFAILQKDIARLSESLKAMQIAVVKLSVPQGGYPIKQNGLLAPSRCIVTEEHQKLRTMVDTGAYRTRLE